MIKGCCLQITLKLQRPLSCLFWSLAWNLSNSEDYDPVKKFLENPDLVEMVLPFLDASSILNLAIALLSTVEILRKGSNWINFIRRSCSSKGVHKKKPMAYFHTHCLQLGLMQAVNEKKEEIWPII